MYKKLSVLLFLSFTALLLFFQSSCKYFKKDDEKTTSSDTTAVAASPSPPPVNNINLPHADSSLVPILKEILTNAFDASNKKDYKTLASLIVYRGPDVKRYGYATFDAKNAYDRKAVAITADVFNKWNKNIESLDYARVFALDQPDGRTLPVLEVIFVSRKNVHRKFFGFLEINGEFKIADVTSNLQGGL